MPAFVAIGVKSLGGGEIQSAQQARIVEAFFGGRSGCAKSRMADDEARGEKLGIAIAGVERLAVGRINLGSAPAGEVAHHAGRWFPGAHDASASGAEPARRSHAMAARFALVEARTPGERARRPFNR